MGREDGHYGFACRRNEVLRDIECLKRDLDSYNENHPDEEDIVLSWDLAEETGAMG